MFSKVLVANRGEIAVRAFRAAYELGAHDGRGLPLRGPQVRAPAEGRRGLRDRRARAPGAGLPRPRRRSSRSRCAAGRRRGLPGLRLPLREPARWPRRAPTPASPSSARPADVLHADRQQGARDRRGQGGRRADAGVSVEPVAPTSTRWSRPPRSIGLPGVRQGGRRRRRPRHAPGRRPGATCARRVETCMREAEGAFGDPTVFLEQAVVDPRHIEVQILADGDGNVDPPVRARLLGAAAAPEGRRDRAGARTSTPTLRERMCADAVRVRARDRLPQRRHRRVPARPRGQLRLHRDEPADPGRAHGHRGGHRRRPRAGADADRLRRDPRRPRACARTTSSCAAPRCSAGSPPRTRPTASAPTPAGSPPTARPAAPASASTAARRTPAPRSARTSTRCWSSSPAAAATFAIAVERARRAVAEFRIRGVSTNIPFLQAVLDDPDFRGRPASPPSFIEEHPQLLDRPRRRPTAAPSCCTYLADVTVNQPHGAAPVTRRPGHQAARASTSTCPAPDGTRQRLLALGPGGVRPARCASSSRVAVTDTTFRDAHQSLLATRVRTRDLLARRRARRPADAAAAGRSRPGAARRTTWRCASSSEDPWERLAALREAVPNICLQMLLRGRNTVGYTPYPTEVTDAFVHEAAAHRHRHLPDLRRAQRRRADAARRSRRCAATGTAVAEVALCYTGDLSDPDEKLYTLDYYLRPGRADRRRRRARAGDQGHGRPAARAGRAHAGHARCASASTCRCTCTPTTPPAASSATLLAAIDAGVDAVDAATRLDGRHHLASRRCRRWSRPPTTPTRATGLDLRRGLRRWSPTGRRSAGSTRRSSPGCRRRPAGSTPTRSPAASCPTCASRRSRSASARSSSRSRTCTPRPTASSATSSR